MKKVRFGERWVGEGEPCFVIAEAGANHNRDLAMGKELIDVAAEAGADAVKFQTYSAETLYSKKTPRFSYLEGVSDKDTWDLIKGIELPREWQADLAAHAARRGIPFFSSPFDHRAVDELAALGVPAYKIASFEIVDLPLIGYAASQGKPLILSTGLASYEDIADALQACRAAGNAETVLLQCASLYPAPPARMNLARDGDHAPGLRRPRRSLRSHAGHPRGLGGGGPRRRRPWRSTSPSTAGCPGPIIRSPSSRASSRRWCARSATWRRRSATG